MLHAVDAERFADARVGKLSGGEQQRVLIAHALISRPQLLLLDEPLANLDIAAARRSSACSPASPPSQQVAVLLSAHEMNPLLPVMDRIVYLAGGRAASGTTDEVVQRRGPQQSCTATTSTCCTCTAASSSWPARPRATGRTSRPAMRVEAG